MTEETFGPVLPIAKVRSLDEAVQLANDSKYGLGSSVPHVDTYLLPIVALIVVISLTPLVLEVVRSRRGSSAEGL